MTDPMDLLRRTTENLNAKDRRTRASDLPLDSTAETFMGASIGAQSNLNLETSARRVRRPRRSDAEAEAAELEALKPAATVPTPIVEPVLTRPLPPTAIPERRILEEEVVKDPISLPKIPENESLSPLTFLPKEIAKKPSSSSLDEEINLLKDENEAFKSKIASLESHLGSLQIYPNSLASFVSDPTPSKISEYIQSLQSQVTNLQTCIDEKEKSTNESPPPTELQEQIMDLQEDLQSAKKQITNFQIVINEKDQNIQGLQSKITAMETAMTESNGTAIEGATDADAAEAAIIEMAERELKMMEDLIKEQEAYISELEREMGGGGTTLASDTTPTNTSSFPTEESGIKEEGKEEGKKTLETLPPILEKQLPPPQ